MSPSFNFGIQQTPPKRGGGVPVSLRTLPQHRVGGHTADFPPKTPLIHPVSLLSPLWPDTATDGEMAGRSRDLDGSRPKRGIACPGLCRRGTMSSFSESLTGAKEDQVCSANTIPKRACRKTQPLSCDFPSLFCSGGFVAHSTRQQCMAESQPSEPRPSLGHQGGGALPFKIK